MFAGYGHAGGVDDMRIYAAFPQPASQPEAIAPSLVRAAIRVIGLAALIASSRQPCSSFSRSSGFGSNFFSGSRLTPGISPATSQFDRLSSMTAISVLSCMKAAGLALLLSWGFCIRSSVNCKLIEATILQLSRRLPHSIFIGRFSAYSLTEKSGGPNEWRRERNWDRTFSRYSIVGPRSWADWVRSHARPQPCPRVQRLRNGHSAPGAALSSQNSG